VLGSETQYRSGESDSRLGLRVVDLSAAYDIVLHRDVFGMLAHQIDDENVQRYGARAASSGPVRSASRSWTRSRTRIPPVRLGLGADRDTFVDPTA